MKTAEIHLLPDEIINKIAAGEVIERPASAVKELIENSIDAGATRIQVQIEEGGKKKILVIDNGKGMGKKDLDLCYLRHTTSKLYTADDLFHLQTNGFRGEAVASIAAISKMTISTSTEDGDGGRLILKGGQVESEEPYAAGHGTTFLIEDLFFNTPVRRTFLGSETSEGTKILDVIIKTSISHPEIRFDYKVGEKSVFIGVPGELRSRLAEAIGSGIAKSLLPVDYTEAGIHVTGYTSPTTETKGKRHHQFLFIRNRPIENKMIGKAVSQAYEPYGAQCKPVTVLFLDMPDTEFDVNVHPAKREVRFANQNLVFLVVSHAIRDTFQKDLEANSPFIDRSGEFGALLREEAVEDGQRDIDEDDGRRERRQQYERRIIHRAADFALRREIPFELRRQSRRDVLEIAARLADCERLNRVAAENYLVPFESRAERLTLADRRNQVSQNLLGRMIPRRPLQSLQRLVQSHHAQHHAEFAQENRSPLPAEFELEPKIPDRLNHIRTRQFELDDRHALIVERGIRLRIIFRLERADPLSRLRIVAAIPKFFH